MSDEIENFPKGAPHRSRCIGIIGCLLGHSWRKGFEYVDFSEYCWRCGMPQGGWRG